MTVSLGLSPGLSHTSAEKQLLHPPTAAGAKTSSDVHADRGPSPLGLLSPAMRRYISSGRGRAVASSPNARRSLFAPHLSQRRSVITATSEVCFFQQY